MPLEQRFTVAHRFGEVISGCMKPICIHPPPSANFGWWIHTSTDPDGACERNVVVIGQREGPLSLGFTTGFMCNILFF